MSRIKASKTWGSRILCYSTFTSFAVLVLMIVSFFGATTSGAQYTTARLGGTVQDVSGAAVVGANVTVEQVGTGYKQTVQSNAVGNYLFPSLPIGDYRLTVETAGFNKSVQSGVSLSVGQTVTWDVTLRVGAVAQEITVQGNANQVTTDDAAITQVIDEKAIMALPMNGREAQQLVFLVPGAVDVSSQNCGNNCEGGVLPSEQYAKVNGGGANGVYYLLDGVDYNDTYINANLPFPSPDAVQEFNVQTDNMSAAYGNATGGVANVVSKSGTNQFHGDAFEYLRNYAMDAKNYFASSPDPLKQNQFGGVIGGPIWKGKLFFFGSYQGTRVSSANNGQIAQVPTAAERGGDFTDLAPEVLTNPNSNSPYQFVNNVIDPLAFDPTALYILNHIPLPNDPSAGAHQLVYNAAPTIANTNEYLGKIDYNIGKHHLSVHYFQLNYKVPIILPPSTNILAGDTEDPQNLGLKHVSAVDIYSITPSLLLNSYFGWTSQPGTTLSAAPFDIAQAGSNIALPTNFPATLNVGVSGDFNVGLQAATGIWNRSDMSDREIVTWIKGNHELQMGGEWKRIRAPMGNSYQADGEFFFTNGLSGDNLADYMLGAVSSFTQGGGLYLNFTGNEWSGFIQDNWRATKKLTLSLGLRWDPFLPYTDKLGRVGCFVPGEQSVRFPNSPAGLIFGGSNHDAGCPASSIFNNLNNYGPRFGFAYQLTNDGKTSLRGGAGYYYQLPNTVAFQDVVGIPPFAPIVNIQDTSFTNPYTYAGIANPFPAQFGPSSPGPNSTFPQNISFTEIFDRHFHVAQMFTYNLTLERAFGSNWFMRTEYVGNHGTHLGGTGDQEAGLLALNPSVYIPGQSNENNVQQRRIYPNFGFVDSINSGVNSNYNAGQFQLEKRLSHGLSFQANLTWSKALNDFAPNGEPGGLATNTCSCGRYFDYGPDTGDESKVFRLSGFYAIPSAHVKGIGAIINGWNLSAITNWQSGFPFTIFAEDDNSFSAMGADRADTTLSNISNAYLGSGRSHAAQVAGWFNTSYFLQNAIGTFGNTGKNALRGPRLFTTDAALLKTGKMGEYVGYQFRAEFYNVFNNVNFGNPDAGLQDGNFGQIASTSTQPRILQMAFKVIF